MKINWIFTKKKLAGKKCFNCFPFSSMTLKSDMVGIRKSKLTTETRPSNRRRKFVLLSFVTYIKNI